MDAFCGIDKGYFVLNVGIKGFYYQSFFDSFF